jgi:hypothetical protein
MNPEERDLIILIFCILLLYALGALIALSGRG